MIIMNITKIRDTPTAIPVVIPLLFVSLSLGWSDGAGVEECLTVSVFVLSNWLVGVEPVVYYKKS